LNHFIDLIEFILHIDKELVKLVAEYGSLVYGILFTIIFLETGLVITPFLPGDSLLFAAGAIAAQGSLKVEYIYVLLVFAAIIGDNVNYWIGRLIGEKIKFSDNARILKKKYITRTHAFYEKYGTTAIIIARFVPIVRTLTPFVAGLGRMTYKKFLPFDVIGGILWVSIFVFGGYLFGNLTLVKDHFSLVVIAIIFLSLLPAVIEYLKHKRNRSKSMVSPLD